MNFLTNTASADELIIFDIAVVKLHMEGVFAARIAELKAVKDELESREALAKLKAEAESLNKQATAEWAKIIAERASLKAGQEAVAVKEAQVLAKDKESMAAIAILAEEAKARKVALDAQETKLTQRNVALLTATKAFEVAKAAKEAKLATDQNLLRAAQQQLEADQATLATRITEFNAKLAALKA